MFSFYKLILYLLLMIIPLSLNAIGGFDFNISVNVTELPVGKKENYVLNRSNIYIIGISNMSEDIVVVPPRIFIKCKTCEEDHPLLVVVRQNKGVLSWELPVVIESNDIEYIYKETERTLCPYDILNSTTPFNNESFTEFNEKVSYSVTLSLSTSSIDDVEVELLVNLETKFVLDLDIDRKIQISPSSPSFFLYKFPPQNVTSVLLHITSTDDICMIVSIQNVSCPIFDLEQNIRYKGLFQTVTQQGGSTLTKEDFPYGFYVVLIVSEEDRSCSSALLNSHSNRNKRTKNVILSVSKTISENDYLIAIIATLVFLIVFCTTMFVIYYCKFNREKNLVCNIEDDILGASTSETDHLPYNSAGPVSPAPYTPCTDTLSMKTDSSLDETDLDVLPDAELDKNIFRMKGYLCLSDLARKNHAVLKKKSELYFWNLLTVAIFYFLPVIQLVITNQYQLKQSGEEDLCYYNFLCAHPLWFLSDFNHVFSNIGYFFLGGLFIILTMLKENVYKLKISSNKNLYRNYGIPQHFGLFYAMGAALIVEGVLSSCYHVCPNHYNFQFDSSFMYVICALCMIKIYQTRHPDINASAYSTFFLLAGAIFIGMWGVISNDITFWVLFTILHLFLCLYLSLQIYYVGRWRLDLHSLFRFCKELRSCQNCQWRFFLPMFPSRFVLLVIANGCNWGLAIGSFMFKITNFSSYLLTIFMVNLMLYTTFYIIMKFICRERIMLQSFIHMLLASLGWASALYFFFIKTISWRLTPAESKLYNQKCLLLDFYDNHDVWHFLSAAAMFFSFMVLLNLDDDLVYVHRSKISVF